MRFKVFFTSLLVILSMLVMPLEKIYADPYGQSTYGAGEYNCNIDANTNDETCAARANESGLTDTGRNLVFIVSGSLILIGVSTATALSKRRKK